jgi:hypothetical protein
MSTAALTETETEPELLLLCPRCQQVVAPIHYGSWVFVSCPKCGKTIDLGTLVTVDGVRRQLDPPAEWPQPFGAETGPLEISPELLAAVRLAAERIEEAGVRYEAGHQRYLPELFHLARFLQEQVAFEGMQARAEATQVAFFVAAAAALRQILPDDGAAMRAANLLESAAWRFRYERERELPNSAEMRAARELLYALKEVSEEAYCAQWLPGQEYLLWEGVFGDFDSLNGSWARALTPGRRLRLRELCEQSQGWWSWPDNDEYSRDWICPPSRGEVFVPLAAWRVHVES